MIIPRPTELRRHPGHFPVPATLHLSAGPGAQQAADLLAGYLGDRPRTDDGPVIRLELSGPFAPEGYRLAVRSDGVTLTAATEAGLRHGVQTLRQLLVDGTWPCVTVVDAPRLPWRGVLLDVARHHMPLDFLYRFVDQLALHKLSVLHLHLTDDQGWRVEIDGWPLLTEIGAWRAETVIGHPGSARFDGTPHGGYYTQAELRSLAAYAAERGVTIVPEIDLPGHARAALAAYPSLGNHPKRPQPVWTRFGISEDILNVRDSTLDFCRDVVDQVAGVFPARYVHVGGDECPTVQWERDPVALARAADLGLTDVGELRGWFVRELHAFLAGRGRSAACWEEAFGNLPADVLVMAWKDSGLPLVERGHPVVMAPYRWTYLDYPQRDHPDEPLGQPGHVITLADVYGYSPPPGVLGIQAQLWTEYAPTPAHVEYLAWPRLCALAEVAWSGAPDYPDFVGRLESHEQRLRSLGVRSPVWRTSVESVEG
ncbi:MAG TPA: beta-N-acetylhexosaminidase [Pseudonocardiaceae bacterium]|nr:beta-N-acetylhexosaminidase [Pseudonocardiaceae bacterium]